MIEIVEPKKQVIFKFVGKVKDLRAAIQAAMRMGVH